MLLCEAGYEDAKHNLHIESIRKQKLPINKVIPAVVNLYIDLYEQDAIEINNGMCEDFAADVCSLVSNAKAFWLDEINPIIKDEFGEKIRNITAHKVIKYRGRYYDSQCPEGTTNWKELIR